MDGIQRRQANHLSGQKRGRPLGSNDSHPQKRRNKNLTQTNPFEIAISTDASHEIIPDYESILKEMSVDGEVQQISIP